MLLDQVRRDYVPLRCDDTWLWHDDDAEGADDGGSYSDLNHGDQVNTYTTTATYTTTTTTTTTTTNNRKIV